MRTDQLTKCSELLQKLRARLGACSTGLSPQVIINITGRSLAILLIWFSVFAVSVTVLLSPSVCLDDI